MSAAYQTPIGRTVQRHARHVVLAVVQLLGYPLFWFGFVAAFAEPTVSTDLVGTVRVLAAGHVAISLAVHLCQRRSTTHILLGVRVLLFALTIHTVPAAFDVTLPLALVLLAEGALLRTPLERVGYHALIVAAVFGSSLGTELLGVNTLVDISAGPTPLTMVGTILLWAGLVQISAWLFDRHHGLVEFAGQQTASLAKLSMFNLQLQQYAQMVDVESEVRERNRISRELHDISGYMFTNLVALMDAAISLGGRDPARQSELLLSARKQAQEGLHETRMALRRQRAIQPSPHHGLRMIHKIVSIFREVTGTAVELHLGNLPASFDTELNLCLYRVVQESITNAIRHGKATAVRIQLWIHEESLVANIHDNGVGAAEIVKGIGLAGMEERVRALQGSFSAGNAPDGGFELEIRIPLIRVGSDWNARQAQRHLLNRPPNEREINDSGEVSHGG